MKRKQSSVFHVYSFEVKGLFDDYFAGLPFSAREEMMITSLIWWNCSDILDRRILSCDVIPRVLIVSWMKSATGQNMCSQIRLKIVNAALFVSSNKRVQTLEKRVSCYEDIWDVIRANVSIGLAQKVLSHLVDHTCYYDDQNWALETSTLYKRGWHPRLFRFYPRMLKTQIFTMLMIKKRRALPTLVLYSLLDCICKSHAQLVSEVGDDDARRAELAKRWAIVIGDYDFDRWLNDLVLKN